MAKPTIRSLLVLVLGSVLVVVSWLAIAAVVALVLRALWNAVVPSAFGGPVLSFWQAFCGMFLLSILSNFFRSDSSTSKTKS